MTRRSITLLEELVEAHRAIMAVAIAQFDAARKELADAQKREANAPCGHCGKPADFRGPCGWGGCPLGADL